MEPLQITDVTERDFCTKTELNASGDYDANARQLGHDAAAPLDEFMRTLQARAQQMKWSG